MSLSYLMSDKQRVLRMEFISLFRVRGNSKLQQDLGLWKGQTICLCHILDVTLNKPLNLLGSQYPHLKHKNANT